MKRVPLSRRYVGHGAGTTVALVREPTAALFLDFGEPYEAQKTAAGERVVIENLVAVRAYVEACVTFEGESEPMSVLGQLGIADARAVKAAVLDFFQEEEGKSALSSTSSSGAPGGLPTPSSD